MNAKQILRKISGPEKCTDQEYPMVEIGDEVICLKDDEAIRTYVAYCYKPKRWWAILKENINEGES